MLVGLGRAPPGSESFVELFYEARVARWLEIEPDVQLIVQRGEPERATLVAGVRARLGI